MLLTDYFSEMSFLPIRQIGRMSHFCLQQYQLLKSQANAIVFGKYGYLTFVNK